MIKIIQTKELKSTTLVEGIMIQTSDKKWYKVTCLRPPRNSWFLRGCESTSLGRDLNEIYTKKFNNKPSIKEGGELLLRILNNLEENPNDKFVFN